MKQTLNIPLFIFLMSCNSQTGEINNSSKENSRVEDHSKYTTQTEEFNSTYDSLRTASASSENLTISHPKAIGIWMPEKINPDKDSNTIAMTWPLIFSYDGTYVTVQPYIDGATLAGKWHNNDGYYKLKSIWRGDSLFYLPPLHKATFLANFADTSFFKTDVYDNAVNIWEYQRISKKEVPDYLRAILKERDAFNYDLTK